MTHWTHDSRLTTRSRFPRFSLTVEIGNSMIGLHSCACRHRNKIDSEVWKSWYILHNTLVYWYLSPSCVSLVHSQQRLQRSAAFLDHLESRIMPHVDMPQAEFKVVMLGDTFTGKTSLVLRFVEGYFRESGRSATVGAFFVTKR